MADNIIKFPGSPAGSSLSSKGGSADVEQTALLREALQEALRAIVDRQTLQLPANFQLIANIDVQLGVAAFPLPEFEPLLNQLFKHCVETLGESGGELKLRASSVYQSAAHEKAFVALPAGDYLLVQLAGQPTDISRPAGSLNAATIELAQSLGGELRMSDQQELGLNLALHLPVTSESAHTETHQNESPSSEALTHILLVDDDEPVLRVAGDLLESLGYRVTACGTGDDALRRLRRTPNAFQLILTDVTMPRMSGFELLELFGRIQPDIPVALMTGFPQALDQSALDKLGVQVVLEKPFTRVELGEAMKLALRSRRSN